MASGRQKPKPTSGTLNGQRRNGKAWKKGSPERTDGPVRFTREGVRLTGRGKKRTKKPLKVVWVPEVTW